MTAKDFNVTVLGNATVLELKGACAKESDIPVENQKIIFRGKILKDD